ncbi:MAG: hypothetical protein H0T62_07880 [Parachlamydiaceae bacterium]|nr:hypothetical protein [Parachlamydiaceae bacterium]
MFIPPQPQQSPTDRFYAALDKAVDADKNSGKTNTNSTNQQSNIKPRSAPPDLEQFKGKSIKEKMNDISNLSLQIRSPDTDAAGTVSIKDKPQGREVRHAVHDLITSVSDDHPEIKKFSSERVKILESSDEGKKARLFSMGKGSIRANDSSYGLDIDKKDQTKISNTEKTYHSFLNELFENLKNIPLKDPSSLS